jgi:hypothetical protein
LFRFAPDTENAQPEGSEFPWLSKKITLASPVVFEVLFERFKERADERQALFNSMITSSYTFSVAVGHLYESDCIEAFGGSAPIPCRYKEIGKTPFKQPKTMPARKNERYKVKDLKELVHELNTNGKLFTTHFVPRAHNQGCFDSFALVQTEQGIVVEIYQMTVSRKHPVKREYVKQLMKTLREALPGTAVKRNVQFIFVVPKTTFDEFPACQDEYYKKPATLVMEWNSNTTEERMKLKHFNIDADPTEPK